MEVGGGSAGEVVVLNCAPVLDDGYDEAMAVDVPCDASVAWVEVADVDSGASSRKVLKRKRACRRSEQLEIKDKDVLITSCRQEIGRLYELYKEVSGHQIQVEMGGSLSQNAVIGCLLEESSLPFGKLVEEIFGRLKDREGVTMASVRSSVLFVGQRVMYGVSSADADVLEDESQESLWCWETRDLRTLPSSCRGTLQVRRAARKKINERISTILSTLQVLESSDLENQKMLLKKTVAKLQKSINIEGIQLLIENLKQKLDAESDDRAIKLKEKELIKEMQKGMIGVGGNIQTSTTIQKDVHDPAMQGADIHPMDDQIDTQQCERETEAKKQLKKQQEEKEQKRREKEAAELKRKLSVQKQADMMQRFLKSKKLTEDSDMRGNDLPVVDNSVESCTKNEAVTDVTSLIDSSLHEQGRWHVEDLWRLHCGSWREGSRYKRRSRWGVRHQPKNAAFKELALQKPSGVDCEKQSTQNGNCSQLNEGENTAEGLASDLDIPLSDNSSSSFKETGSAKVLSVKRKLLQFDKSNRPAYYGTWSKTSSVIGPRHPLRRDPDLDYEVDSDEEWEEEDPGEDLSDCEKDNEECLEDTKMAEEESESEDGFVVPDGYFSDNEGVCLENLQDEKEDQAVSSNKDAQTEAICTLLRQQQVLAKLTDQALRRGQPLVVYNLKHDKTSFKMTEDLAGAAKLEQLCLQALCMCAWSDSPAVDLSWSESPTIDSSSWDGPSPSDAQDLVKLDNKKSSTHAPSSVIGESDMPEIVVTIQACRLGINKVAELLHQKFPSFAKSQLRNKIREVAQFVDNRWQVKKDVLEKFGFSTPEKCRRPRGIAMYFSKRCLPPQEQSSSANPFDSSPQPCSKP